MTLAFAVPIAVAPSEAHADRRIFGFTYPYQTLPAGSREFEHYLDVRLRATDNPATPDVTENDWHHPSWRHQIELEYGITDHLDFGLYNVFSQAPYGDLRFDSVKLRSRYRFGDEGQYAIDPALYAEVIYSGDAVKLEQMVILGKRIGRLELAANLLAAPI